MNEDLMKLLDAQEIDLEIDKLIKSKEEYPKQIEKLKKEITDLEEATVDIKNRIKENKKNRLLMEEEIDAECEILAMKEKRLLETKTNKEYTAVQHEIEKARERIDNLETGDLELMAEFDDINPQVKELQEKLKTTFSANNARIEEMQSHYDSVETDVLKLKKKSDKALANVNKRGLSVYNRLRKGRKFLAVVTVDKKKLSCKGCFKQLPPQKVVEIRRANKLMFCENCGRILVWDSRGEKI